MSYETFTCFHCISAAVEDNKTVSTSHVISLQRRGCLISMAMNRIRLWQPLYTRWKARVRLPIRHNWTFFASCYHWRATRQNVAKLIAFWRGGSVWAKISEGRGRPLGIFLVSTKIDTFCYLTVQTAPCYTCRRFDTISASCSSVRMRRGTDRHTDSDERFHEILFPWKFHWNFHWSCH